VKTYLVGTYQSDGPPPPPEHLEWAAKMAHEVTLPVKVRSFQN
jgi:hypothetical protein